MTGVEFLRHVKQLRPDATRLLFTGYADIKAVIDAINEGHVFRYLGKPWEPERDGGRRSARPSSTTASWSSAAA